MKKKNQPAQLPQMSADNRKRRSFDKRIDSETDMFSIDVWLVTIDPHSATWKYKIPMRAEPKERISCFDSNWQRVTDSSRKAVALASYTGNKLEQRTPKVVQQPLDSSKGSVDQMEAGKHVSLRPAQNKGG